MLIMLSLNPGPVFGNMDNFTGLGVFVDTYPNEEKYIEVCCSSTAQIFAFEGKSMLDKHVPSTFL